VKKKVQSKVKEGGDYSQLLWPKRYLSDWDVLRVSNILYRLPRIVKPIILVR